MPAPSPAEQQRILAGLADLSVRELRSVWAKLDLGRPDLLADPLSQILAALIEKYGSAAASLAADWFDEARDDAGAVGSFTALPALPPDTERVEALSRWGIGPLFGVDPNVAAALGLLAGGLQREVFKMPRATTEGSATLDPAGPTFARHASANACAFCRMLATRGAAYTSAEAAVRVVGRGTDVSTNVGRTRGRQALGVRTRGTRKLGDKYHDWCRCTSIAVWPGQEYDEAPYVQQWREQYAASLDTSKGDHGAVDVKKTLANWRDEFGAN